MIAYLLNIHFTTLEEKMVTFSMLRMVQKGNIITYFLILFSLFFFSLQIWLDRFFGVVDFEQFIIFLSFGATGLLDSDDYIITKFIQICFLLPLAGTLILFLISKSVHLFINTTLINKILLIIKNKNIYISFVLFIFSVLFFLKGISFEDFILKNNRYDFIKDHYVEPNLNDFTDKKTKKNLVLIHVESLEDLLLDKNFLSKSAIDKFSFSEFDAKKIKKFKPIKYTNWTIGSIVATHCGIPQKPIGIIDTQKMKLNRNKPNKLGFAMKNFLPNAYCLGDLLKASQYKNIFINAVDLNFAATGLFFVQHGYDEVIGKKYFEKSHYDYDSYTWGGGPHDSVLFDLAKEKIAELNKNNDNFNITILTTDTHDPGFVDNKCDTKTNTSHRRLNKALICSSETLYKFVKYIQDNYSDNTVIVILGDHIYPGKINGNYLNDTVERNIYNRIISKDFSINRDLVNHYDMFPTILNLLNFSFKNNRLGLGYSVVNDTDIGNYNSYFKNLEENIQNKSDRYVEFWK